MKAFKVALLSLAVLVIGIAIAAYMPTRIPGTEQFLGLLRIWFIGQFIDFYYIGAASLLVVWGVFEAMKSSSPNWRRLIFLFASSAAVLSWTMGAVYEKREFEAACSSYAGIKTILPPEDVHGFSLTHFGPQKLENCPYRILEFLSQTGSDFVEVPMTTDVQYQFSFQPKSVSSCLCSEGDSRSADRFIPDKMCLAGFEIDNSEAKYIIAGKYDPTIGLRADQVVIRRIEDDQDMAIHTVVYPGRASLSNPVYMALQKFPGARVPCPDMSSSINNDIILSDFKRYLAGGS